MIDEADVEHEEVPEEKPEGLEVDRTGNMPYALAPTDPYYEYQWYHNFLGTVDAWDATKGKGVKVAVLDTGIDFTHPDLKSNIAAFSFSFSTKRFSWDTLVSFFFVWFCFVLFCLLIVPVCVPVCVSLRATRECI